MAEHPPEFPVPVTEAANPRTQGIDRLAVPEILALLLEEDARVPEAVRAALPSIERATDLLLRTLEEGGRWFNLGAGTSGRLGAIDAAELPPTYSLDPDRVQAIVAGGPEAMMSAAEGAEDDPAAAGRALGERGFSEQDALLALSASGRTPFVLGGVEHASALGAATIGLTCAPGSPLAARVACPIVVAVGPEAIAGSTRLKGGLAQKMVLHMISTAVMIRMGRVRGNLMAELHARSNKLRERALRIVMQLSGRDRRTAEHALGAARGSASQALARIAREE